MQKLCCVHTRQHPLPVWSHKFVLSSTTHISTNSHPFLVGIVSLSDYTHSFFLKKKSDQIKILPMWIKGIAKKHRTEIKRIRLDNSGENKSLQKECEKQNLGIIFEFTAPDTPQQNSVAERRIPYVNGQSKSHVDSGRA